MKFLFLDLIIVLFTSYLKLIKKTYKQHNDARYTIYFSTIINK